MFCGMNRWAGSNDNGPHWPAGSGATWRCSFVGVGAAL